MTAIFKLEMIKNMHDKGLIFWTLILPILFTVLFISIFTATVDGILREEMITSIVPGYTVMFVFFIMISMGTSFLEDRDKGMIARLASTPLSPLQYVTGKWIAFMIVVITQIVLLLLFGKVVYAIPIEQPLFMCIIAVGLTFCTTGIGLALSVMIRTNNMGIAITQVIALAGALIGGLWIPLDMMPDFFQKLSVCTPQYWAHTGFKAAMNGTGTYSSIFFSTIILLGFGCVGLFVSVISYPGFLRRAKN